ncbi:MAG: universal stress protein [Bacteroidota bacterium]
MTERVILFPTDFSERSLNALNQAIAFAERFNDKMIIFHSYSRPFIKDASPSQTKSELLKLEQKIDEQFETIKSQHPELQKLNYEFRKEIGVSTEMISRISKTEKIDLIIMATKGARGLGEIWGTTSAKIVKLVDVPVLIVPDGSELMNMKKIGLACDYSEEVDYRKLAFLVEVAETQSLDIDVFSLNRDEKKMTSEELEHQTFVKKQLQSINTSFNFEFTHNIEDGVIDYCQSNKIGIMAIVPKSYTYIERLFHESLTERMAFRSPIPLLVLK